MPPPEALTASLGMLMVLSPPKKLSHIRKSSGSIFMSSTLPPVEFCVTTSAPYLVWGSRTNIVQTLIGAEQYAFRFEPPINTHTNILLPQSSDDAMDGGACQCGLEESRVLACAVKGGGDRRQLLREMERYVHAMYFVQRETLVRMTQSIEIGQDRTSQH